VKSIKKAKLKGKNVIVRLDLDVPMDGNRITDDTRLQNSLPTLRLLKKAKQIFIIGHRGRPKKKDLSLKPVAKKLEKLLKVKIGFEDFSKKFVMLENLRYDKGEKENNSKFAKKLASLADIYVNDAFADSHRKDASIVAITKYLPSYAGINLEKEVKQITQFMKLKSPSVLLLGGAKIDKLDLLKSLIKKVDIVLIGGAMMFTFLKALKYEVGKSLVENDKLKEAKKIMSKKIILPIDTILDNKRQVYVEKIPKNSIGYDIGYETVLIYSEILKNAKTIIWNGPMGFFEKGFDKGTKMLAKVAAKRNTLVGGGDTLASIGTYKNKMVSSTAGGAFLTLISGKELPGLKALK